MKSPEQSIFDDVFSISLAKGYATFDYKPAKSQDYPFVFIGSTISVSRLIKAYMYGNIVQTIEVWHSHKERQELTNIMEDLKRSLIRPRKTTDYHIAIRNHNTNVRIDDSTGEPLLQGIIEVEYRYNRR